MRPPLCTECGVSLRLLRADAIYCGEWCRERARWRLSNTRAGKHNPRCLSRAALRALQRMARTQDEHRFTALLGHMPRATVHAALRDERLTPATATWFERIAIPAALAALQEER